MHSGSFLIILLLVACFFFFLQLLLISIVLLLVYLFFLVVLASSLLLFFFFSFVVLRSSSSSAINFSSCFSSSSCPPLSVGLLWAPFPFFVFFCIDSKNVFSLHVKSFFLHVLVGVLLLFCCNQDTNFHCLVSSSWFLLVALFYKTFTSLFFSFFPLHCPWCLSLVLAKAKADHK